eukprot:COSAG06_NODE_75014_length_135_cov_2249.250000_1_plen_45_part_11
MQVSSTDSIHVLTSDASLLGRSFVSHSHYVDLSSGSDVSVASGVD